MRTFDIALKHLNELNIDLKEMDIYNFDRDRELSVAEQRISDAIEFALGKFQADKQNNKSNDYYRNIVFITAVLHLAFKARGMTSFWDVAREIIEGNKDVLKTKYEGWTPGSEYPKVMVDKWKDYCNNLREVKKVFALEGECNMDYFMAAYHYNIEPEKA